MLRIKYHIPVRLCKQRLFLVNYNAVILREGLLLAVVDGLLVNHSIPHTLVERRSRISINRQERIGLRVDHRYIDLAMMLRHLCLG